jgi:hypothetical protein
MKVDIRAQRVVSGNSSSHFHFYGSLGVTEVTVCRLAGDGGFIHQTFLPGRLAVAIHQGTWCFVVVGLYYSKDLAHIGLS